MPKRLRSLFARGQTPVSPSSAGTRTRARPPQPRPLRPSPPAFRLLAPRAGFTLIELLVVMGILAALLAISVMAFRRASASFKNKAAAAQLETVIRQARNSALQARAPAFVELEVDKTGHSPQVVPWQYRLVGQWHFESAALETPGAFGKNGIVRGCKPAEGKIGKCLSFGYALAGGRLGSGLVDLGEDKDWDLPDGGYLEAYVFGLDLFTVKQYVFHKKESYALLILPGGLLAGWVGGQSVVAQDFRIPPRRWTKVALAWDRRSSRLFIDDAVLAVGPGMEAPLKDESLEIGSSTTSLLGMIDEPKVMTVVRGDPLVLPLDGKIEHNASPWDAIFFDIDGALDLRYHTGPVKVSLIQGNKRRTVSVSMLGLTNLSELENLVVPEETGARKPSLPPAAKPKPKPLRPALPPLEPPRAPDPAQEQPAEPEEPPATPK